MTLTPGTTAKINISKLHFDTENPRFTPDKKPTSNSDLAIIQNLAANSDLAELVQSISNSGYIPIEPLIVKYRGDKLIVLEGNRRLAALKFLTDEKYREDVRLSFPKMPQEIKETLNEVAVYLVQTETEAQALIGFKHINGAHAWDAHAKAIFATKWLNEEKKKGSSGLSLAEISAQIGDRHDTLRRMVIAQYVLLQAEDLEIFSISDRKKKGFSFSHLYTGLSFSEFSSYLGMDRTSKNEDPIEDPVPVNKLKELKTLLHWLYGSKDYGIEPIIQSQNPHLRQLRQVLSSPEATIQLENTGLLADAIIESEPAGERFSRHITRANQELTDATKTVHDFDPSDQTSLLTIAETAEKRLKSILASMRAASVIND